MLSRKMQEADVRVWMVNTGWSGGPYGTGKRMSLKHTRALITAALEGSLDNVAFENHEIFGLAMPLSCPGVPEALLNPRETWPDKDAYDHKAQYLADAFLKNFEKFAAHANAQILSGAPKLKADA
jgi:phosphoenolpyruvate carboxykinase (ATP)